jgi:dethiobiotin synthetase
VTRAVDDPIRDAVPDPARPATLVVVAGTGTEVGKTWVSVALIDAWVAHGLHVSARKPAQSFDEGDLGTDAELLAAASGDDPNLVCPPHRWYPVAMAPPMAADVLGREPVFLADLVAETNASWHDTRLASGVAQIGLVELAGGPWSPAAHDGDGIELTERLGPDVVVLVADAGLGTINAVRPAVAALAAAAPGADVVVVLNRYDETDELHRRNREWLTDVVGVDLVVSVEALADRVADRH